MEAPPRCLARRCRGEPLVAHAVVILRGPARVPVKLNSLRCPRCNAVVTPRAERERLRGPVSPAGG